MSILPLPVIVEQLTRINGCTEELAKAFIVEFASLVSDGLAGDGNVDVKGIGSFRRVEVAGNVSVEFAPDVALAEAVNLPFAMFEPVELDDDVTEEMLDVVEADADAESSSMVAAAGVSAADADGEEESEPKQENSGDNEERADGNDVGSAHEQSDREVPPVYEPAGVDSDISSSPAASPCDEPEAAKPAAPPAIPGITPQQRRDDNPVTYERVIEKERVVETSHHSMNVILTAFLAFLAGLLIGYFVYDRLNLTGVKSVNIAAEDVQVFHQTPLPGEDESSENESPAAQATAADSVNADAVGTGDLPSAPPQVASVVTKPQVVTDTVRTGRFLTTMAQRHYGKKKFWVYIYLENSGKLGNPDKIPAGTVVVIPPAEKYGIKAGDLFSEQDAQLKAAEIMARHAGE